jgi:hypothetical protein
MLRTHALRRHIGVPLASLLLFVSPLVSVAAVTQGPIPGVVPGDRESPVLEETYPFFSTPSDLAANGYVEEEFYLSGNADAYATNGALLAEAVPYRTRIIVRRPVDAADFNGTVLMEWQNVTAGYDLDALWDGVHAMRSGYAWIGVSAQRVGVDQLRGWSPTRYGELDVTGGGAFMTDQLSYEIFAQAAAAVRTPQGDDPLGGLQVERVLAIGASQSAGRMTTYYNNILPYISTPVFDGYAFIVGSAPSREGNEPVFQVLSETDVRTSLGRRPDSAVYRRWEVAGTAHSGYDGQVYRRPISERDLPGGAPEYNCTNPPFSRVPLRHVIAAAYDHLVQWVDGVLPPSAPYLEFTGPLTMARNELGLALGGIQLSQVAVPTALNVGTNSGESFCFLFGSHSPFDDEQLASLYRNHGSYASQVAQVNEANVAAGYIVAADAEANVREAARSDIGRR